MQHTCTCEFNEEWGDWRTNRYVSCPRHGIRSRKRYKLEVKRHIYSMIFREISEISHEYLTKIIIPEGMYTHDELERYIEILGRRRRSFEGRFNITLDRHIQLRRELVVCHRSVTNKMLKNSTLASTIMKYI